MADLKISQLNSIVTVVPATDVLPVVQGGTTLKITPNQILGAGGTATLASATITGTLTVDTTTLFVNSSNDRVGIGTVTPLSALHVGSGTGLNNLGVGLSRGATTNFFEAFDGTKTLLAGTDSAQAGVKVGSLTNHPLYLVSNNTAQLEITHPGLFVFNDGAGGTRMTLNSTGLGVGKTPSARLDVASARAASVVGGIVGTTGTGVVADECQFLIKNVNTASGQNNGAGIGGLLEASASNKSSLMFYVDNGTAVTNCGRFDSNGNLLVGTADAGSNSGIGLKVAYSATAPYFSTVGSSTSASEYSYLLYSTGGTPAFKFYVSYSGQISATSGTVAALSDARFKENIQDIDVGLGAILALKPRKFDWKAGRGKDIKGDRGFIAQEFETVFPNLIDEWADPAPEGEAPYKSVRQDLIPVLVKAIQELTARVQTLEAK